MTELTDSQREQLDGIESSARNQIEERLQRLEKGDVVTHKIPSSYRSVGMKYENVAISRVYKGDIHAARKQFMQAAEMYRQAAETALEEPPYATSFQRVPMTFVEALYAASLAGEMEMASENSKSINKLNPERGSDKAQDDILFERDKYFLSQCLAGVVLDQVAEKDINELNNINQEKTGLDKMYGKSIIKFTSGSVSKEDQLVKQGVEFALKYHDQQRHEDNVIDLIMASEATALLIIAENIGFNIEIHSDFIPAELVNAVI
ncbi:hypothetical protein [Natronoarchaeum rubrum]|uniref:hypothetical protein n=1 Tax=Natronoarchaeum rubrum TaxID=755311 RepID=UPI0021137DAC|nr:hypothetical protein [Natronoarchaeum rubrum]